jgi:hypothetical protein
MSMPRSSADGWTSSPYAYLFCDGVHVKVRLGEDKRLCLLVVIGVREDGRKELLAVEDGYRESTDSWAEVLRDLKARGMSEPKLLTADGALGLWGAAQGHLPEGARATLLGSQDRERAARATQARAAARQGHAARGDGSTDGYFTGLGVAAVQRAAAVSRMRCASTSWSSAETAPLLPSSAGLSVNSLAHNPEENSSGSIDRQPQEPIEHRD